MNGCSCSLAILTAVISWTSPAPAAAQSQDEAEIRSVAMRQADTWNRHDATAYAALFTEDCDVVNVVGWWWKGRAELEQKLTAAFSFVFRESKLTINDLQVRLLAPEIALAHARWSMAGAPRGNSNAGLHQAGRALADRWLSEHSQPARAPVSNGTQRPRRDKALSVA